LSSFPPRSLFHLAVSQLNRLHIRRLTIAFSITMPPAGIVMERGIRSDGAVRENEMADQATPNLPSRDFETTSRFYARLGFV